MKKKNPISTGAEWTIPLIEAYDRAIGDLARDFRLDTFPNQIEIITAEQMMDAYTATGMPVGYHHWSFGKHFLTVAQGYQRGHMGLAYELVINSNPCIAYLMEENTLPMQALVIAHACYGHNSFFKNNYLFKMWTTPDAIVDYLVFAKQYIAACEEQYGIDAVETLLDACHALMLYGVDKYRHPAPLSLQEEKIRQQNREVYLASQVNELWRTIPQDKTHSAEHIAHFPKEPQENILYFLEKHAPLLKPWQREIIRIVRKLAQYFYPQKQTKIMNEGWASFWHYTLLHALYDEGFVTDEFMLEILQTHTSVIMQPPFHAPYYNGINPYALGYGMMQDIRRICENPTAEDRQYFPNIAGQDWLTTLHQAMQHYKDESFIAQYLSPHLIRDLKLFHIQDDDREPAMRVAAIHNEAGYQSIRETLSQQYNLGNLEPDIQVYDIAIEGDRTMTLRYTQHKRIPLAPMASAVLQHLHTLWKFPIVLQVVDAYQNVLTEYHCPERSNTSS